MSKVSIVVPCYYSAECLPTVVSQISKAMIGEDYELILVNDGSTDNTFSIIHHLAEQMQNLIGVDLSRNFGQHSAIFAGLCYASGDEIVCMDDDGQTPPSAIPKLLSGLRQGQDVVYARYSNKQHSKLRNFGSAINDLMARKLIGKPKGLFLSSFFAMKRYIMLEILRYKNPFVYLPGLILRSTSYICNVDVDHQKRTRGESGYTLKKLFMLWLNGFTAFSVKPLRVADFLGVVVAGMGFLYLIYTVVMYFFRSENLLGWSSLMAVSLMVGGSIMLMLGMIGEYLGRAYISLNGTPQFVVRQIISCEKDRKDAVEEEK